MVSSSRKIANSPSSPLGDFGGPTPRSARSRA
jgi:hypothetical protein